MVDASYPIGAPQYTRTTLIADVFTEQASRKGESNVVGMEAGFRHQLTPRIVLDAGPAEFAGPSDRSRFFFTTGFSLASERDWMAILVGVRKRSAVSMRRSSVRLVGLAVLAVVLGSCIGVDAHQPDVGAGPKPCDVTPVTMKAGVERDPGLDRTVPAVTPGFSEATVVWHCGPPPDTRPTVIAVDSPSLSPQGPRAPPRG